MFKKKINKKNTRILIIPPDHSFGSFGDQAMILSALNVIKSNFTSIDIALFAMNKFYGNNLLKDLGYNIPIYSPDEILEQKNFFEYLCNYFDTVFIIGADILDGGCGIGISKNYFDIIQIAYKKNLKIVINGFSFNDRNYPEIIKLIKKISKLAILNVRDEVSYQRLEKIRCKNLKRTADIAFLFDERLYKKSDYCQKLIAKIKSVKQENKIVIGIHVTCKEGFDKYLFIQKIITAFKNINNLFVVILPHDKRIYNHILPDVEFCNFIETMFKANGIPSINAYNLENEIDVKSIVGYLDFVITSRMHLAIATLSKNVPVISFIYQGKFEGLYKFYQFNENLMLDSNSFLSEELLEKMEYLIKDKTINAMLDDCNKNIFELAKQNIRGLINGKK